MLHVSGVPLGNFNLHFLDLPLKLLVFVLGKSERALGGDSIRIKNDNERRVGPVIGIHIFQRAVRCKD
jgi:hypothetical protein